VSATLPPPEPQTVVDMVERYVDRAVRRAREDDSTPLDDSSVFGLHLLATEVYARGYHDGERATQTKLYGAMQRGEDQ
jgi:hypothetical protein